MSKRNFYRLGLALFTVLTLATPSYSQTPTQEQIEQFRKLPRAQQEALAEAYGIDLDSVLNSAENTSTLKREEISGPRTSKEDDPFKTGEEKDDLEEIAAEGTDQLSLEEDQSEEATNEKLELFGYDIFNYGADSFTPATDIPPPSSYVMGPGDTLVIQLYGKENNTHTLEINREGSILFPGIGPVPLAGMTFESAKLRINEIVSEQMIGIKSSTTLGNLRSIRIFVLGEAQLPGSYVVSSLSTMTNAIMASGGVTKIGSLRNIQLKRKGQIISQFDLYDLLLKGDTSKDSRLQPGDVIFIPTIGNTVSVSGEVKRPAIYELKAEDTIGEAIQLAGGPLPTAYLPATRIERVTDDGDKTLIDVNAKTKKGLTTQLNNADVIQVFSTLDTLDDVILLKGHIKRPGGFKWKQGLRFADIVPNIDALSPNPDIGVGIIRHVDPQTRRVSVSQFSPQKAWQQPNTTANPELKNRDTIYLFSYVDDRNLLLSGIVKELQQQAEFNAPRQTVTARGNLRSPGAYPYFEDMSSKQLISLAGGLLESSSGINAEITRQTFDHEHNSNQQHFTFDMRKQNPKLLPGDALTIQKIPYWKESKTVELLGEVVSPGIYTILPGETLTQVLERAGGLTPYAYIEGTTYSRKDLRELEQKQLEALKSDIQKEIAGINLNKTEVMEGVSEEEASQIIQNIDNSEVQGLLVINLKDILDKPSEYDFELEDGDIIEVPNYKPTVTVVGEVQHSTSHFYDPKISLNDYLESSGGTKRNADKKRIYVVRANGQVIVPKKSAWFKHNSVKIMPGDTIIVPIDAGKVDTLKVWQSVTTIMYQAALGVTAVSSL